MRRASRFGTLYPNITFALRPLPSLHFFHLNSVLAASGEQVQGVKDASQYSMAGLGNNPVQGFRT
jgi:hypothetical protein